jgi:hypothetical protein
VFASTDRLHDYERVMAVNYFGAVRMVLALLPLWQQRRFGHVVNVSSAGLQASSPRYSAYLPPKAALDAFAEVVSTETLSDHVTFTTIHMPLVTTPMIAPSNRLNPIPAISAEHAAAMVVRGLIDKPVRIDTPLGTLGDAGRYLPRSWPDGCCTSCIWAIRTRPWRAARPCLNPGEPGARTGRSPPSPGCGCRARSSAQCDAYRACTGERSRAAPLTVGSAA